MCPDGHTSHSKPPIQIQVEFFLRNGFCIVPAVVAGEELRRLQASHGRRSHSDAA